MPVTILRLVPCGYHPTAVQGLSLHERESTTVWRQVPDRLSCRIDEVATEIKSWTY